MKRERGPDRLGETVSIQLHVASLPDLVEPPSSEDTEGCLQCQQGSKMVLFVTGRCHWRCDYCPLSENRREIEYIYANERRCDPDDWEAVLEEAHAMNATGTGITGGDPMMDRERTLESIRQLKREFGSQHHIHMYTSIPFQPPQATALADAGLDEIRFHLLDLELEPYLEIMGACEQAGMKTGVELPCEPDQEERLLALLEELRDAPITFLNLNELEITVGNLDNMELRGFNISNELTAGAEGSAELATRMRTRVQHANANLPDSEDGMTRSAYGYTLKFCTSTYKDSGQLRRRFLRRGEASISPHEQLTEDGTIVFGSIYCSPEDADSHMAEIVAEFDLPAAWMRWDEQNSRLEVPLMLAEEIADEITAPAALVEVHPTHERLEVSLVWLNDHRPPA